MLDITDRKRAEASRRTASRGALPGARRGRPGRQLRPRARSGRSTRSTLRIRYISPRSRSSWGTRPSRLGGRPGDLGRDGAPRRPRRGSTAAFAQLVAREAVEHRLPRDRRRRAHRVAARPGPSASSATTTARRRCFRACIIDITALQGGRRALARIARRRYRTLVEACPAVPWTERRSIPVGLESIRLHRAAGRACFGYDAGGADDRARQFFSGSCIPTTSGRLSAASAAATAPVSRGTSCTGSIHRDGSVRWVLSYASRVRRRRTPRLARHVARRDAPRRIGGSFPVPVGGRSRWTPGS